MALKLTLDSLDGVDAGLVPLYVKTDDGKFKLDAEGLDQIQGALKAANKEAADRRVALEKLKGVDPEEYHRLKAEAEERTTKGHLDKGEFEKIKEQMAAKHLADIQSKDSVITNYRSALEQHLIDAQATAAIAEAKGIPQLLLPHIKGRVKVLEENGQFKVQILNAAGGQMVADAAGTPATFKHLIDEFKADPIYGRAFEGTGASGGGANQTRTTSNGKPMALSAFNLLSPADRAAHIKAGGTFI